MKTQTMAKTYQKPQDYARDVAIQALSGWHPIDSVAMQQRRSIAGLELVPFSRLRGRKPDLIITYERQVEEVQTEIMPAGLPGKQKREWYDAHRPKGLRGVDNLNWMMVQNEIAEGKLPPDTEAPYGLSLMDFSKWLQAAKRVAR